MKTIRNYPVATILIVSFSLIIFFLYTNPQVIDSFMRGYKDGYNGGALSS